MRFLLFITGFTLLIFFIPTALAYIGISKSDLFNINQLLNVVNTILNQAYNNASIQEAGLNKISMNLFQHYFIYLFYPLDFLSSNLLYIVASIENLILLFFIMIFSLLCFDELLLLSLFLLAYILFSFSFSKFSATNFFLEYENIIKYKLCLKIYLLMMLKNLETSF